MDSGRAVRAERLVPDLGQLGGGAGGETERAEGLGQPGEVGLAPTEFCSRVSKNIPARMSISTQNWARVKPTRSRDSATVAGAGSWQGW
jgi:hypothetical protein